MTSVLEHILSKLDCVNQIGNLRDYVCQIFRVDYLNPAGCLNAKPGFRPGLGVCGACSLI